MIYYAMLYFAMLLTACGQLCLKYAYRQTHRGTGRLGNSVNPFLVSGYLLLFGAMFFNLWGLQQVELKMMAAVLPVSYVLVSFLSAVLLKETFNPRLLTGTILIILGTALFHIPSIDIY